MTSSASQMDAQARQAAWREVEDRLKSARRSGDECVRHMRRLKVAEAEAWANQAAEYANRALDLLDQLRGIDGRN